MPRRNHWLLAVLGAAVVLSAAPALNARGGELLPALPTLSPLPTILPLPTLSPLPTVLPLPTLSPLPTVLPLPTLSPLPTILPLPTAGLGSPTPSPNVSIGASATPSQGAGPSTLPGGGPGTHASAGPSGAEEHTPPGSNPSTSEGATLLTGGTTDNTPGRSGAFEGIVLPAIAIGVPLLVALAILAAQLLGGTALLPAIRKTVGGFGVKTRTATFTASDDPNGLLDT